MVQTSPCYDVLIDLYDIRIVLRVPYYESLNVINIHFLRYFKNANIKKYS